MQHTVCVCGAVIVQTYYLEYYSVPLFFVVRRFFFGLRAVLMLRGRPQYIKNAS